MKRAGPLPLTSAQTESLRRDLSCIICFDLPSAAGGEFLETPCCSRIVHKGCVTQTTTSSAKGDNKDKKHVRGCRRIGAGARAGCGEKALARAFH